MQLTAAARERIAAGYHMMDATDAVLVPLQDRLKRFARRQSACTGSGDEEALGDRSAQCPAEGVGRSAEPA